MCKNILITGCNRGVGEGIGDIFKENEYNVLGLNRHKRNKFTEYECDVSNWGNVKEVHDKMRDIDINVLVLNAGIRRFNSIEDMSIEDWNQSVEINLNGVFNVVKAFIPNVKKCEGELIIIGSHSEKYTFENGSAYCSTKGGLKEFGECLMQEVRYDNVRVSYLSLGSIKNRDHGIDERWKLTPRNVGESVLSLVNLPKNILVPYIDIRPIKPLKDSKSGIEKLQYV